MAVAVKAARITGSGGGGGGSAAAVGNNTTDAEQAGDSS